MHRIHQNYCGIFNFIMNNGGKPTSISCTVHSTSTGEGPMAIKKWGNILLISAVFLLVLVLAPAKTKLSFAGITAGRTGM